MRNCLSTGQYSQAIHPFYALVMSISKTKYIVSAIIVLTISISSVILHQIKRLNSTVDLLVLNRCNLTCTEPRSTSDGLHQISILSNSSRIMSERNMISRTFNSVIEMERIKNCLNNPVSSSGAFCTVGDGKHLTDEGLAKELSKILKGCTVLSLGEGRGEYRKRLLKMNEVATYDGYDGTPGISNTTNGSVGFMDLSIPQYGIPIYDWVLSIEVAEHIPRQFEHIFISNVVRHARHGIILSWAVIGQGGFHHVNNREPTYVEHLMKQNCFVENEIGQILRNASSYEWLKKNVRVYKRLPNCPVLENDG